MSGRFVVAEAPVLPFRDGAFGLLFDRGCLQAIPRDAWYGYFGEVERLLAPGGMLQLYVSRPDRRVSKLGSARGLKLRLRRLLGGTKARGPAFLSPALIRELMPPSLEELAVDRFQFETVTGATRQFFYGLFRKRS